MRRSNDSRRAWAVLLIAAWAGSVCCPAVEAEGSRFELSGSLTPAEEVTVSTGGRFVVEATVEPAEQAVSSGGRFQLMGPTRSESASTSSTEKSGGSCFCGTSSDELFRDGFESGTVGAWGGSVP